MGVIHEHVEIVQGPSGPKPRIVGHRIGVQDVVIWHEKLGMSPRQIVDQYPTITLADVYAALAYYWDHPAEIEARIAEDLAYAEEFRRTHPGGLQNRLSQRRGS